MVTATSFLSVAVGEGGLAAGSVHHQGAFSGWFD